MLSVRQLLALVGTSGLDALDAATFGSLRERIRASRADSMPSRLMVAADERGGVALLGLGALPLDRPTPYDQVLGLGARAALPREAGVAFEAILRAQKERTGEPLCVAVGDALAALDEADDSPELPALRADLVEVLEEAVDEECRAAWHRQGASDALHELTSNARAILRVGLAECLLVSPLASSARRLALVRAREDEAKARPARVERARVAFAAEHRAPLEGLTFPEAALRALDARVDDEARALDAAIGDAPATSDALRELLDSLSIAMRHHALAAVGVACGDVLRASAEAAKAAAYLDGRCKDEALAAMPRDLDPMKPVEPLRRMLAPLGGAYVGQAFDAIDYPPFLGPESERAFVEAVADTFWRAVAKAIGGPTAEDLEATEAEAAR
jgi:hypothetical protein